MTHHPRRARDVADTGPASASDARTQSTGSSTAVDSPRIVAGHRVQPIMPREPGVEPVLRVDLATVAFDDWPAFLDCLDRDVDPGDTDLVRTEGPWLVQGAVCQDLVVSLLDGLQRIKLDQLVRPAPQSLVLGADAQAELDRIRNGGRR